MMLLARSDAPKEAENLVPGAPAAPLALRSALARTPTPGRAPPESPSVKLCWHTGRCAV